MMNEEKNNYKKIGVLAVVIFAVIFGTYNYFKESRFDKQLRVYAVIDDASGLHEGLAILTKGLKIGELKDMKLQHNGVLLELLIYRGFNLNKSAQFYIKTNGPFEGKVIEIRGLQKSNEYYVNGDTIKGKFGELSIRNGVDSTIINRVEPSLKELGKAVEELLQKSIDE